jgi:hypothetical protein
MRVRIQIFFLVIFFIIIYISAFSQENFNKMVIPEKVLDSLRKSGTVIHESKNKPQITLTKSQALAYLQQRLSPQLWIDSGDPLRQAFDRLVYEAAHSGLDSLKSQLLTYPFDSLSIPWDKYYTWEPIRLRIPVVARPKYKVIAESNALADSMITGAKNDSLTLQQANAGKQYSVINPVNEIKDTTVLVVVDTLTEVTSSYPRFPFRYFSYPYQGDSIKAAVNSLLNYLDERDSSVINITGAGRTVTPIMLNSKSEKVMRYWLKNEFSDSVIIWIGNPARNTLGLYLEQGVSFRRPGRQSNYSKAKVNVPILDHSTLIQQNIALKKQYWKYRAETSFVLNQALLTNWVRGGENSISTTMDMTGYANYNNKALKMSSDNFARFKFGYIKTGNEDIRKNIDLLETNSKLNHTAFGKFEFSGILLFKTQIARGYVYPNDSIPVSKFMNPAILTVGFGLDYKPNKNTSINFSPFSYKGTFVPDTALIDQTQYGIAKNRRSLNEPGASFMITNEFSLNKTITIINRLQLFTNYIHNPQNVDVDWEMIATAKLNWFTDVRFNTHLIFDDDTKTVERYKNGEPVLNPDGTEKKTARIQFKELLGFSLIFRF